MNLIPQTSDPNRVPLNHKSIVARYEQLRKVGVRLSTLLVSRLTRDMMYEGAKRLGIFHKGKIVFDNESQVPILMDYCIFNIHRQGRNSVEKYLLESPPASDPTEVDYWNAMQTAKYTVMVVESVERGLGCYVKDLATGSRHLLVDIGLSRSANTGFGMSTRLLNYGDFVTTGGAALPMGNFGKGAEDLSTQLRDILIAEDFDPATLISAGFSEDTSSLIRYDEASNNAQRTNREDRRLPTEPVPGRKKQLQKQLASLTASNQRCRCGSGKMYKNCCGK